MPSKRLPFYLAVRKTSHASPLSTADGGDAQVELSKWGSNTRNNYGAMAMWGMPVKMRIDYLLLHNYAHSIRLLCIAPASCLGVRNYYCHIVSVLQEPLRVRNGCPHVKNLQRHHLEEVLYIHVHPISVINIRHYETKWSIWVKNWIDLKWQL